MIPEQIDKQRIEHLVGTSIVDIDLYQTAFTHRSALKQYSVKSSYETLEFLGDAVLSFVITKYLYDKYTNTHEGFLTKLRTKIVRGKTLSIIAQDMGLESLIIMDDKGMRNNWNRNPKILEDVLEAFIGAIYLDLGIIHTKQFIYKHILSRPIDLEDDNYKDIVMRYCQSQKYPLPVYIVDSYTNSEFTVSLYIRDSYMSSGVGKTKKDAEQNAAESLLRKRDFNIFNESPCRPDIIIRSVGPTEVQGVV